MSRLCLVIAAALCATARAEPSAYDDFVADAKPILDTRLRFENVEQDGVTQTAEAVTLRARLGFESGKVAGTALLVEGEFVRPFVDDYNSTINGSTVYPVVADPRSSELNRLQMTNSSLPLTTVTLGRQRIVLDDHRFVGDVGWRQNEQTFDAIRIVNKSVPHLTLDVTYLDQVNRVFGRDSAQGRYYGDSVLANASYETTPGKLTAFAYRIDIDPLAGVPGAVRDASQTFGVRFAGAQPLECREAVVHRVVCHAAGDGQQSLVIRPRLLPRRDQCGPRTVFARRRRRDSRRRWLQGLHDAARDAAQVPGMGGQVSRLRRRTASTIAT